MQSVAFSKASLAAISTSIMLACIGFPYQMKWQCSCKTMGMNGSVQGVIDGAAIVQAIGRLLLHFRI